jgi:hypothetical protein
MGIEPNLLKSPTIKLHGTFQHAAAEWSVAVASKEDKSLSKRSQFAL